MSSWERVNVLLSRARDALILIGNAHTFQQAKKGGNAWRKLLSRLRDRGHIYNGLPVICTKHTDCVADLGTPEDFDTLAPAGGCTQAW